MSLFKDYNVATWEEAFAQACHNLGCTLPEAIITDGKIHRFSANGKKNNSSGWYVIFADDTFGGAIGNWGTGDVETWSWSKISLTPIQRQGMMEKWNKAKKKADEERARFAKEASEAARAKWDTLNPVTEHAYLAKKGIRAHGIKMGKGRLYIPLMDATGQISSLQSIDDNGTKIFMKGPSTKGLYFIIGTPQDSLFIAEGYATAASIYEATGQPTAVAFSGGNIGPAIESLKQRYPKAQITICADNDSKKAINNGLVTAKEAATKYGCKLAYPVFTDEELAQGNMKDFNDLATLRGRGAVNLALFPQTKAELEKQQNLKFKTLTIEEIQLLPPVNWLIDKVFPVNSFCMIYGEPGQKKTFLALDMALSIAANQEWHEREVKAGTVLYIAGEGVGGLNKRIGAWMAHYQLTPSEIDFLAIPVAVNFIDETDINQLIATIDSTAKQYSAIFIDTVARAILGSDENSSTDIGKFVAGCDAVRNHTGATVIGIHHSGKDDSRGMRGSSALLGAVDTVLKVEQNEDTKNITVTMKKQKDEEQIQPLTFASKIIEFGIGQSSIVLEAIETPENDDVKANTFMPKKRHDLALEYLQDCIANSTEQLFGKPATQLNQWKLECSVRELGGFTSDAKRMAFNRAYKRLTETKQITCKNGLVSIIQKGH